MTCPMTFPAYDYLKIYLELDFWPDLHLFVWCQFSELTELNI